MPALGFFIIAVALFLFKTTFGASNISESYVQFVDDDDGSVGLRNDVGDVCLSVKFRVEILNMQFNNTIPVPFDLVTSNVTGKCAMDRRSTAILGASVQHESRTKKLKFYFATKEMRVKKVDELRWQLRKVVYTETFKGNSAVFQSDNSSVIFSAPLTQKYVCKDRINVTLHSTEFSFAMIAMFFPEVDVQPYGPKSNVYLCERTRRRTLAESLQDRSTVFSGVVLAVSSVGTIVGHMVRRHFLPQRKQIYENLSGN